VHTTWQRIFLSIASLCIYTKHFPDTAFWLNTVTYLADGPVPGTNSSGETGNMIQSVNIVLPSVIFCIIPWQNKMICVSLRWGVHDTTLCDKVCPWLATGQCFFPGTSASSTNKTDRYDIAEILLKVALNTINQSINQTTMKNNNISWEHLEKLSWQVCWLYI
jgi:hypothetical protein